MVEINKISNFEWEIPKTGDMKVPGKVFASSELIEAIKDDKSLEQVSNVAKLPGIVDFSFAMPDIHQGYGFPIGGVAAFDLEKGVVSPGGIGYDINCSIRLLKTNLKINDIKGHEDEIAEILFKSIPSGIGVKGLRLDNKKISEVLDGGARWAVENGFGKIKDLDFIEDNGVMSGADSSSVSQKAKGRGQNQLGTLGSGNHFLDVLVVDELFDDKVAKVFGLEKNQIVIMIHCGSRGLGHQVASDYIKEMEKEYGFPDFDRELVNAPIKSKLGQKYLSAMNAAANFSFANKQVITQIIRDSMKEIFPGFEADLVYEVSHNIAKEEKYKNKNVLVMRKGATRSFGPGNKNIVQKYRKVGQPVIIPGSMGTSSYVLVGLNDSSKSFCSSAHGAGRAKSRKQANKDISFDEAIEDMKSRGVKVKFGSKKGLTEESPFSYKDIDGIIDIISSAKLSKKVIKMQPLIVILG